MTDRTYLAEQVTRRFNYLKGDTRELARLLEGETLSPNFHDDLRLVIAELQRLEESARPKERSAA